MSDVHQDLLRIAIDNSIEGRLYEPRLYSSVFDFTDAPRVLSMASAPEVFRNGEDVPVQITHLVSAIGYAAPEEQPLPFPIGDERAIQRYGLRVKAHENYYMNPAYPALPLWHTENCAASDVVTRGQSGWEFARPVIMGPRDVFEVRVALESPILDPYDDGITRSVSVSFRGVGLYSRQPRLLSGFATVTAAMGVSTFIIPTDTLRNTGPEPIEIHEVTFAVSALSTASDPTGDIRLAKASIRLAGNGTGRRWTITDPAAADDLVPMSLWGLTTGRAVIHRIPGNGWLWKPGVGVTIEAMNLTGRQDRLYVAAVGYAVIP